jgi:carbon starvation protein
MLQDLLGSFVPAMKKTDSWVASLIATFLCVSAWGYILYQGVVDPLGGINSLWPLFGISNQMLAGVALMLCTVVLFKMKRQKYAWVTVLPASWLIICTLTAGWQKVFDANPKIGFLALADKFQAAIDKGVVLAPAKSMEQMKQIVFNNQLDAALAVFFIFVVVSMMYFTVVACLKALREDKVTSCEMPYQAMPAHG